MHSRLHADVHVYTSTTSNLEYYSCSIAHAADLDTDHNNLARKT